MTTPSFLDEVAEQPGVLLNLVMSYADDLHQRLQEATKLIRGKPILLVVGMGSSLFAGEVLVQRFNAAGYKAFACDASELYHYKRGIMTDDVLMLAISQSGESAETCLVAEAKPKAMPLICMTNNEDSRLARMGDVVLPLFAGEEAGTSSKTFVATMALLHLLADAVLNEGMLSLVSTQQLVADMGNLIKTLGHEIEGFLSRFGDFSSVIFTGRGPGLVSATQGALITQEMTQIPAAGLSAGQFRHGPIEAAGPHALLVIFAPSGATTELLVKLAGDTADYGSPTWLITDTSVQVAGQENLFISRLPQVSEALSPLLSIVASEFLGVAIAKRKGLEPGRLQRVSKVTDFE